MFSYTLPATTGPAIEDITGYHFEQSGLLWEALQAPGSGVTLIDGRVIDEGNKRLALVGGAALKLTLLADWFPQGGSAGKRSDSSVAPNPKRSSM